MSGSSLDGLDIAYCRFSLEGNSWKFDILSTEVIPYPEDWKMEILQLPIANTKSFWETHIRLGHYFGNQLSHFMARNNLQQKVDLVASHGHTVFHFPQQKFTAQIGDGAAIATITNLPVVCDFRSDDIALGGQGTPIVPIGDLLLFKDYRFCLNIGGISNISGKTGKRIVAFDICAANQVLNLLANKLGKEYDADGDLAASGKLNTELLERLNAITFYQQRYPKSLDNSFSREVVWPIIASFEISTEDKLRTYTEHIAMQVATHLQHIFSFEKIAVSADDKMLLTGGGAFNKFLVSRMAALCGVTVVLPDDEIVKFKEALVIAFMGVLRLRNERNVLCSVTGASKDSTGGAMYIP